MKSQHIPSAQSQGDWDRNRDETDPRTGASGQESGRPYPRSAPDRYPESHQQYQAQRDHPGSEYFSGSPGHRQQEAFQPSGGGHQQGGGSESYGQGGHGGYGREGQGQQPTPHQTYGGYQDGQPQNYSAQEAGQFFVQSGYPSGGQPSGGYGSYGAYQVDSRQVSGRASRAPKDYVRSDERIRELICETLLERPGLDASDVSVQVSQGCVRLEGTVPERRMKHEIEDVADGCWGVKDVDNRIRVQGSLRSGLESPAQGGPSAEAASGRKVRDVDMSPLETGTDTSAAGSAEAGSAQARPGQESESEGKG